jgi:UDP-arabinose 4-epimerase
MNVLVTGGAGYIGSHACKYLAGRGIVPISFDNLSRGHAWAVQWGPLEIGDLRDQQRILQVLQTYRPEVVLHFAALAYVGESVINPSIYFDNNITGSISLLNAMLAEGVHKIVFSSSCTTYGTPEKLPILESAPQNPVSPYGLSKLTVERILQAYADAYGVRSVTLRYFNACGADPEGHTGECHDPEPHLVPLALAAADSGRELEIFGTDYPTPDGTCIRDYVHVSDLARAHGLAVDYLIADGPTKYMNLGTGVGVSVREVIRAVEEVTGRQVPARFGARRPGDCPELVANAELAGRILDWKAEYTDIKKMVLDAWKWRCSRS